MPIERRRVALTREGSDVERCIDGDCIGAFCPCLCKTSLKVRPAQIRLAPIGALTFARGGRERR